MCINRTTLRGQLRWWWRVIHSNFLEPSDLLKLESLVWGLTDTSSPIRIEISPLSELRPTMINFKSNEMKYVSFGMWQMKDNQNRYYLPPGTKYDFAIYCQERKDEKGNTIISKEEIEKQVKFALYLLTTYGGLGAKSRKGFGSVVLTEKLKIKNNNGQEKEIDEDIIKSESKKLRESLKNKRLIEKINNYNDWPFISYNIKAIKANNTLETLKELSKAYYDFANTRNGYYKSIKYDQNSTFYQIHKNIKACLGLPRKDDKYLLTQHPSYDQSKRNKATKLRHASPIIFHINEPNLINISIFPTKYLINYKVCKDFLEKFTEYLKSEFKKNI